MKHLKTIFEEFMEQSRKRFTDYDEKYSRLLFADSTWLQNGWLSEEEKGELEKVNNPSEYLKGIWKKKADKNFFNSLVKIHWVKSIDNLKKLFNIPKSSVLCCNGFYKGDNIEIQDWGIGVGVVLSGEVIFASNNDLESGWGSSAKEIPNTINKSVALNKETFLSMSEIVQKNKNISIQAGNEILITNFKVSAIVITKNSKLKEQEVREINVLAKENNIQIFNKI